MVQWDTPMLGSQPQALAGEIFFIIGGDRTKMETIKPYLDVMGRLHMYVGPSASGNRVKLLHNGLVAGTAAAVAETVGTCVQSGVDPYVFYDVVKNGGRIGFGRDLRRRGQPLLGGGLSATLLAGAL